MLNQPMFDWLTLTTFEKRVADGWRHLMGYDGEPQKRLQYEGFTNRNHFAGVAVQNGKAHYLFQSSGEEANAASMFLHNNFGPYDQTVTRCDLQVTIPRPTDYDSRKLYDHIAAWDAPGRPRQPSIIQSGDGCDTIYVGHRSSDRFTRIYVKALDDGLYALRFEVEYKADHAHRVYNDCRKVANKKAILLHEVESLPDAENCALRHFLRVLGDTVHAPKVERVTGQNATIEWLRKQVAPTIERLCNDHEVGHATKKLLQYWYETYCSDDPKGRLEEP